MSLKLPQYILSFVSNASVPLLPHCNYYFIAVLHLLLLLLLLLFFCHCEAPSAALNLFNAHFRTSNTIPKKKNKKIVNKKGNKKRSYSPPKEKNNYQLI